MINHRLVTTDFPIPDTHPELDIERAKNDFGVGRWVVEKKYMYLCKYIDAARAASKRWPNRVYIDPFCGPGRIQVRDEVFTRPNGALTAWLQSIKSKSPFTKLLIGDIDPRRVHACYERLVAQGANVTSFIGRAEDTVKQMVAAVPSGSLCLVYVDPYNLELLNYGMIQELAKLKHVDFVFHFSTMDLTRNIDHELERGRFNRVAPGWQDRADQASKSSLFSIFFQHWKELIVDLGYECSESMPLITNDRNTGLYNLVFFAKHDLPRRLWGDVARGPNQELF